MSTLSDRVTYSGLYSGVANNAVFACIVGGIGLTVFESLRRVRGHRRRPDIKTTKLGGPLGSVETWEFGYMYMGRSWSTNPPPLLQAAPLSWLLPTLLFPEHKLPALTKSLDSVVLMRYMTASWIFVLVHVCTSLPILLPIHLIFNTGDLPMSSMNKASLQYLVTSDRFLWVHVVILYWLAATWITTLIWLTRGALRYRRESVISTYTSASQAPISEDNRKLRGRRQRTVMIENIPDYMRSEAALRDYFERYLAKSTLRGAYLQRGWVGWWGVIRNQFIKDIDSMPVDEEAQEKGTTKVEDIVLVRKTTELQALLEQREILLRKLEVLHVKLASNVLAAVKWRMTIKEHALAGTPAPQRGTKGSPSTGSVETEKGLDTLVEALGSFVTAFDMEKIESPALPFSGETVWEALYRVPPELLHPYQPLIRMKPRYSGRMDVAIDYISLKLATISKQIEEERAVDEAQRDPATTAFVTFTSPNHARKAFRFLAFNPRSPDTCIVTPAPDPSDIIWKRAMRPQFRGAFLRDIFVSIGVWTFTLLWVPPVTIIVGLFSIENLASLFPPLRNYFAANPAKESLVSSFLPTLLYSILVILIPPLLLFITNHGHSAVTASKINDLVMTRYWKFLVCNAVFFFSLGVTTISSFVTAFEQPLSLLPIIAQSFPSAAPFFVGWFVFEMGMHVGLSISLMGFPIWLYPLHRASSTLRRRYEATKPRTYDYSYWLPTHMLVLLIMHVFAILNPLIIPFCFIYLCFEKTIIKHQFMHVFSHAFETNGFNINHRVVRFSCDGLIFSQVIFLVLMILVRKVGEAVLTGLLILATIAAKLYLSRKCKAGYAAADKMEGDLLCAREQIMAPVDHVLSSTSPDLHDAADPKKHQNWWSIFRNRETWIDLWRSFPFETDFSLSAMSSQRSQTSYHMTTLPTTRKDLDDTPVPQNVSVPRTDELTITQGQYAQATAQPVNEGPNEKQDKSGESGPQDATVSYLLEKSVVTIHPPTSRWDDAPKFDASYDSPLYRTSLDNFMWLPRNPLERLDLDDGVNFFGVLLSRSEGGWRGVGRMPKELEAHIFEARTERSSDESTQVEQEGQMREARKSFAGEPLLKADNSFRRKGGESPDEEIELPPIIAARVQHAEQEGDIEESEPISLQDRFRRPSLSRARSSASKASRRASVRKSSFRQADTLSPEPGAIPQGGKSLPSPSNPVDGLPDVAPTRQVDTHGQGYSGGEHLAPISSSETTSNPGPTVSSFKALANVVLREARLEKEEREKKEKKESESKARRSSFAQMLDRQGRMQA